MARLQLGCIADDFTGATDLANNLVRAGMRVVQAIGVPDAPVEDADAVVIALKSRTSPVQEAIAQSLAACDWLLAQGRPQIYFKVCSTFDSTPRGNIGPVAQALLDKLGGSFACVTPAFPETGRTVYKGHLFVGDVLLSDSGMRHHPLTPMTDANLVRVLQAQCAGAVGLIEHAVVARGADAIRGRMDELAAQGKRFAIVDALDNADLMALGRALASDPFVVAGSGVAIGLPQNFRLQDAQAASVLPAAQGTRAIVSGSCSAATLQQVKSFVAGGGQAFALDPIRVAAGHDVVNEAVAWAVPRLVDGPVLVYSSTPPEVLARVQAELGAAKAGEMMESALARIATRLVRAGVGQLVVAGGETSGAVVQALGIQRMRIGPQIDPGVPWCHAASQACGVPLHIALKSGNFGGPGFFTRAFELLP